MISLRVFLLVCLLSFSGFGQAVSEKNDYPQIDLKDFTSRPADYQGRAVAITADVISVSADYRSLDVFDSKSKALIGISLTQLSRSKRQALVNEPVHRVSIYGHVGMINGRAVIKADRVLPISSTLVAKQ